MSSITFKIGGFLLDKDESVRIKTRSILVEWIGRVESFFTNVDFKAVEVDTTNELEISSNQLKRKRCESLNALSKHQVDNIKIHFCQDMMEKVYKDISKVLKNEPEILN